MPRYPGDQAIKRSVIFKHVLLEHNVCVRVCVSIQYVLQSRGEILFAQYPCPTRGISPKKRTPRGVDCRHQMSEELLYIFDIHQSQCYDPSLEPISGNRRSLGYFTGWRPSPDKAPMLINPRRAMLHLSQPVKVFGGKCLSKNLVSKHAQALSASKVVTFDQYKGYAAAVVCILFLLSYSCR